MSEINSEEKLSSAEWGKSSWIAFGLFATVVIGVLVSGPDPNEQKIIATNYLSAQRYTSIQITDDEPGGFVLFRWPMWKEGRSGCGGKKGSGLGFNAVNSSGEHIKGTVCDLSWPVHFWPFNPTERIQ